MAQQADIMCLMLPNTDELLLKQSIFKPLSACYPGPCSNYSNSAPGSPSSKVPQLCRGLRGVRELWGLLPPGLYPWKHGGSPRSTPPSLSPGHHPGLPAATPGPWHSGSADTQQLLPR